MLKVIITSKTILHYLTNCLTRYSNGIVMIDDDCSKLSSILANSDASAPSASLRADSKPPSAIRLHTNKSVMNLWPDLHIFVSMSAIQTKLM